MDFDGEEKEIRELFESGRLKKPPESLMKDYEEGIWKKIHAAGGGPGLGAGITLAGALAFAFLLAFLFFIRPQFQAEKSSAPAPSPVAPLVEVPTKEEIPLNADIDALVEDLFILEMLGEAEGLLGQTQAGTVPV